MVGTASCCWGSGYELCAPAIKLWLCFPLVVSGGLCGDSVGWAPSPSYGGSGGSALRFEPLQSFELPTVWHSTPLSVFL